MGSENGASSNQPVVVDVDPHDNEGRDESAATAPASQAPVSAIATAALPRHPALPKEQRRRSWVDVTPEENEVLFEEKLKKMQVMMERGLDETMAEVALQAADGNLDTAIMMLEG